MLFLFLLTLAAPGVLSAGLPAKCYNVQGQAVEGWLPCDSGATTSVCCGHDDFCLSNGLCLDAGADNFYTQQGCTDANWGAPCTWYCPTMTGNYSALWPCGNADPDSKYCCGRDATCCDGDTSTLLSIDKFTAVSHPGQKAVATTMTTATVTGTATATTTSTSFIATTTVSATATATATNGNGDDDDNDACTHKAKTTQLGLGLGLTLAGAVFSGLALLGGFFWGKRAERKAAGKNRRPADTRPEPLLGRPAGQEPVYHEVHVQGVFPRQELAT